MPHRLLTTQQIQQLVGQTHGSTGLEYPPLGLQPYYEWLVQSLHLLAESSFGALRVSPAPDAMHINVAPGRLSINGVPLPYDGQAVDLSSLDDDIAYVWLHNNGGVATLGYADAATGWPAYAHLKLAEVTLADGAITDIVDRRLDAVFHAS